MNRKHTHRLSPSGGRTPRAEGSKSRAMWIVAKGGLLNAKLRNLSLARLGNSTVHPAPSGIIRNVIKYTGQIPLLGLTLIAATVLAAPASQPARLLPQHQQVLLFFETYRISANQIAADLHL